MLWIIPIIFLGLQWLVVTICWSVDLTEGEPLYFKSKRKILFYYIPFGFALYEPIVKLRKLPWRNDNDK